MLSFNSNPMVKQQRLANLREQRRNGYITQKGGDSPYYGRASTYTVHHLAHSTYELELQIPRVLAQIEDHIFEYLPASRAETFPERFVEATPVGKDLSMVFAKFGMAVLQHFGKRHRGLRSVLSGQLESHPCIRDNIGTRAAANFDAVFDLYRKWTLDEPNVELAAYLGRMAFDGQEELERSYERHSGIEHSPFAPSLQVAVLKLQRDACAAVEYFYRERNTNHLRVHGDPLLAGWKQDDALQYCADKASSFVSGITWCYWKSAVKDIENGRLAAHHKDDAMRDSCLWMEEKLLETLAAA